MDSVNPYRNWAQDVQSGLARCDKLLANGEVGAALDLLAGLPVPEEADKAIIRIQMLHAAGLAVPAFKEIERLALPDDPNPEMLLRFSHVCADAGADFDAARFLERIKDEPMPEANLYIASRVAERIDATHLEDHYEARILAEYPSSRMASGLRLRLALLAGRFAEAAQVLPPDMTHMRETLFQVQQCIDSTPLNMESVFSLCGQLAGTEVPSALVRYLLKAGHLDAAVSAATTFADSGNDAEALALLAVLDELLLRRASIDLDSYEPSIRQFVRGVFGYLATKPERGFVRHRLIKLMSVERSGELGIPILVSVVSTLASEALVLGPEVMPACASPEEVIESGFAEGAMSWLAKRSPCVPGRTILPRELVTMDPDSCVASIAKLLGSAEVAIECAEDVEVQKSWLLLGAAVVPHTNVPDVTINLFRIAATRLAIAQYPQQARDLCEEMLTQCQSSAIRAQAAWFAMADVYSRVNDRLTGLVAFGCALAGRPGEKPLTGFNEINLWVRLLRDCKLYDLALDALEYANSALRSEGQYEDVRHQQTYLRLTIEQGMVLADPDSYAKDLPKLVAVVCETAQEAMDLGEEPTQSVALLSQLVSLCDTLEIELPASARSIVDKLMGMPVSSKAFLKTLSDDVDPISALWDLYAGVDEARFANDAASDAKNLIVPARDVLTRRIQDRNVERLVLPFELLADSGVAAPQWTERARPPRRFKSNEDVQNVVSRLSERNIALIMAAFNNRGRLLSLRFHDGDVALVDEIGFSFDALRRWTKKYPYHYSDDSGRTDWIRSMDEFIVDTLEGCEWAPFPSCPILLILDTDLRSLPSNLVRTGSTLLGAEQPLGSAPSLAWLAESLDLPPIASPRLHAWISGAGARTDTLNVLSDCLRDSFQNYCVEFKTETYPPSRLAGADLAIVAAHGQVSPEGVYFHALNDEGTLKIPAEGLARALRNARVVVLFVCSGGRSDKVPGSNTTTGLAKQLLDAGCSTVIASPWPMEAMVAATWTPNFLKYWMSGLSALEACFEANRRVGGDATRRLAMNLYGDPCQALASSDT